MAKRRATKKEAATDAPQTVDELGRIEEESRTQALPEQKAVYSVAEKIRRRVHNLPDPTRAPIGWDEQKGFERVYPYLRLPVLHPPNHGDTVIFNAPDLLSNRLVLGDNLEFLRTLKSETVDLIYIDPPFFSGRNYNIIWGDSNEVRTFQDIWEGGLDSYLIWLNARLWEMRRVLKKTGSIYVHCDWHASHYIKAEMDKIFGYKNFLDEILWCYEDHAGKKTNYFKRKHDVILFYAKTESKERIFHNAYLPLSDSTIRRFGKYFDVNGQITYRFMKEHNPGVYEQLKKRGNHDLDDVWLDKNKGKPMLDWWTDISIIRKGFEEQIGYPTQKPKALLERIIKTSSNEGNVVADFFVGGGTTPAVAMKLKRRFISCDSSRVAISVTLDRLVKVGEELSGVKSNLHKSDAAKPQETLELQREKVPNIEVSYVGTYPVEKFEFLPHEEFVNFVLTAYGASRNTGGGVTHGYRPPAQQEPLLVGPANPNDSIEAEAVRAFVDEIKARLEPNKMVRAKIIGWRFSRRVVEYVKVLRRYIEKHNLPLEIELVPLDSKDFRRRVLQRYPDVEEGTTLLRFSKAPIIGEIRAKKIGALTYEFEAVDAISTNEDGWLVNSQWDFDYQDGYFTADREYILSREKVTDRRRGERFEAVLTAKHQFETPGECLVACRVQDNLGGESIMTAKISVK